MNFNQAFQQAIDSDPKLKQQLNSYQFQISQQILARRIQLGFTPTQVAPKLNLTESAYRSFENATNLTASKSQYLQILNRLNQIHNSTPRPTI